MNLNIEKTIDDITIKNDQFGIIIKKRDPSKNDDHCMLELLGEDDEYWFHITDFSSFWLDDLIETLNEVNNRLKHDTINFEKDPSGFGYKFKNKRIR